MLSLSTAAGPPDGRSQQQDIIKKLHQVFLTSAHFMYSLLMNFMYIKNITSIFSVHILYPPKNFMLLSFARQKDEKEKVKIYVDPK